MFEYPFEVVSTYVGPERRLTVPWLFRVFQDAALNDAEAIGYNVSKTNALGLLWVFSRVYVRFHKMPAYQSRCKFVTYPAGKKAFVFQRFGKLLDEKDDTCVEISSVWALIHADDRKVELRPALDSVDQSAGDEMPMPGKIIPSPVHYHGARTIEYSDIDLNGHLNNVRYIEMLVNLHSPEFYQRMQFSELLIHYESEIKAGERVELFVDDEIHYVRGVVDDRLCFEANISYAPVK